MKSHLKLVVVLVILCSTSTSIQAQNNPYLYEGGTNWKSQFYDVITANDSSALKSVAFVTEKKAEMYDRDANNNKGGWITPDSWIYKVTYSDGITSEIRIRKKGFTKRIGKKLADTYGYMMGQLPAVLREGVDDINIYKSDALFGGNNSKRSIEITIGETSELYLSTGNMEEILFHEATHATLDYLYGKDWIASRDKDPKFISNYASDYPNQEDISESFVVYTAINYRTSRFTQIEIDIIKQNIPNRLAYYEGMELDMFPFSKKDAGTAVMANEDTDELGIKNFNSDFYYRITNQWQGESKSLDIVNDGTNNTPILTETSNVSGQMWSFTQISTDTYTLSTKWQGPDKILDCVEGENSNRPVLGLETRCSVAVWKIVSVGDGFYKITNAWFNDQSLDIINDKQQNKIQLTKTGNYTGQLWKITKI